MITISLSPLFHFLCRSRFIVLFVTISFPESSKQYFIWFSFKCKCVQCAVCSVKRVIRCFGFYLCLPSVWAFLGSAHQFVCEVSHSLRLPLFGACSWVMPLCLCPRSSVHFGFVDTLMKQMVMHTSKIYLFLPCHLGRAHYGDLDLEDLAYAAYALVRGRIHLSL